MTNGLSACIALTAEDGTCGSIRGCRQRSSQGQPPARSAFLLLCVGVQIVLTGVVDTVRLLPNGASLP